MKIRDFMDISKLQAIQDAFSNATGIAAVTIDSDGSFLTESSNDTEFCIKYTRGSAEGNRRCVKCDNMNMDSDSAYVCHAGLMDFHRDIIVNGEKLGQVVGGQVLPCEPDDDKIRNIAQEIGVDPERYVDAVHKVTVSDEQKINSAAELLGQVINLLVNLEYEHSFSSGKMDALHSEIAHATEVIGSINTSTHSLKSIGNKQKMLSLNASIEAARSGEAGVGFAVVAKSMGDLSFQSTNIYGDIEKSVAEVTKSIETLAALFAENEE